jgi:asparagine synthase (glutamine-hydrolysing)
MCGITGIYRYRDDSPIHRELLCKMTEVLAHRGPDGSGYYYSPTGRLGLGHRRLAIIDLKTGDQPMSNEDKQLWVIFNGEIYNYKELREELRHNGHVFATASDTEVIVHAFEQWGTGCFCRFNGMFAIALWDERNRQLYLARDHFGIKPLYVHDSGWRLSFASEFKSLLLDPWVSKTIDKNSLNMCLAFRYLPSPWTLFPDVRKIPPGSYLVADSTGVRVQKYWDEIPEIDRAKSEAEWVEELAACYEGAVRRQMISDVPIGLSLSGGVDSNALLALMGRCTSDIHTFTVGFEGGERRDDEIEYATSAAHAAQAHSESQVVKESDYFDFMERYLWHLEEPTGNESAAAYYYVAQLARPSVKVLLSGQGADEPLAGYGRHLAARYMPVFHSLPPFLVSAAQSAAGVLWPGRETPQRLFSAIRDKDEVALFRSVYSITTPMMRERLFNAESRKDVDITRPGDFLRTQLSRAPAGTFLERMTYIDTRTSLPDNLLMCGDKMAMAASVEMRVPYLDLEIMKVVERIPGRLKVAWFKNKVIHKRVCERWVPKDHVYRRKIGFNNPVTRWLNQKLEVALNELTAAPDSITRTVLDLNTVRALQAQHKTGERDHHRLLFLILSIEMWNNVFLKR